MLAFDNSKCAMRCEAKAWFSLLAMAAMVQRKSKSDHLCDAPHTRRRWRASATATADCIAIDVGSWDIRDEPAHAPLITVSAC